MEEIHDLTKHDLQSMLGLMDGCLRANDVAEITGLLGFLQRAVPFEHGAICVIGGASEDPNFFRRIINHSYEPGWVECYGENRYQLVDPVIYATLKYDQPVSWQSAFEAKYAQAVRSRDFRQHAREFGLEHGVTCRSRKGRERTLLSLSLPPEVMSTRIVGIVRTAVEHLHEALVRIGQNDDTGKSPMNQAVSLTLRESEVLKWVSIGKTCWEIGKILRISERTVKFHLANAFTKLDVVNRSQAVAKAMGLGLISH